LILGSHARQFLVAYAGGAVVAARLAKERQSGTSQSANPVENEHLRLDLVDDDEWHALIVVRTHHPLRDAPRIVRCNFVAEIRRLQPTR
jgi:hypothetical protein